MDENTNIGNKGESNNSNTAENKTRATSQPVTKKESMVVESKNINIPLLTIEEKAKLVIRGDFGNGEERKNKLGSEYSVIQNKVNEMYAKGLDY